MKKVVIVVAMLAFASIIAVITWFYAYKFYAQQPIIVEEPETKILVHGTIITKDEGGFLVELDEESSFAGLQIYIPNEDKYKSFHINDYIDIYYNGVIIDKDPASLQKIYDIQKFATEEGKTLEWSRNKKQLTDYWYVDSVRPMLINYYGNPDTQISDEIILGEDIYDKKIIVILCYVEVPGDFSEWKIFYVQNKDGQYKIIHVSDPFLELDQIENNEVSHD